LEQENLMSFVLLIMKPSSPTISLRFSRFK
jgi:hypothetical protein